MSGPISEVDAEPDEATAPTPTRVFDVLPARVADVSGTRVMRALPRRARRTVGAWCFLDHFAPTGPVDPPSMIGPHPHIGLQTVTWLLDGETLHTDSLGSEQLIRPGQLNLMSAGRGVAHAEDGRRSGRAGHGVQLWVAQPDSTRHGAAAFEHHADLPRVALASGAATVLVGELAGARSPARTDTPLLGADLAFDGGAELPLHVRFEHGFVVLSGAVTIGDERIEPDELVYLGHGRDELTLRADGPSRVLLLGGEPFGEILMWWNFVGRTRDEMEDAYRDWQAHAPRFGSVHSDLARIDAPRPQWMAGTGPHGP
jgi:redox-sensitive bicupin YhaK (pirin superfamily)